MKKLILIILAISFYPFGCEGQVNGNLGCDTVYIENPAWDAQVKTFEQTIKDLTEQNEQLYLDINGLNAKVNTLNSTVVSLQSDITTKDNEIKSLKTAVNDLEDQLAQKADTIYKDVIVEVVKPNEVDEIIVSHCDSTKLTTWFHHGGISGYPHDISFNTYELGFVRVHFKDSLTNEIKVQAQYKLKRTKDYENAVTLYEFIE